MDHVFTPIEQNDWRVERIDVHPQQWKEFKKNFGPEHLDVNVVPELLKAGHVGALWGAAVWLDKKLPRGHMVASYGDLEKKHYVCMTAKRAFGVDCGNLDCLVDAVHDL